MANERPFHLTTEAQDAETHAREAKKQAAIEAAARGEKAPQEVNAIFDDMGFVWPGEPDLAAIGDEILGKPSWTFAEALAWIAFQNPVALACQRTQLRKHWVRNRTGKGYSLVELPYPYQAGFFFSLAGRMYPTMDTEQETQQGAAFRYAELKIREWAEGGKIELIGEIDGQVAEIPAIEIPYLETRAEHSSVGRIYPINLQRGNWPQSVKVWTDIRVLRAKLLEIWPPNSVPIRPTPPATKEETAALALQIIQEMSQRGTSRKGIESALQSKLGVSRDRARTLYDAHRPSDAPSRGRPKKNTRIS